MPNIIIHLIANVILYFIIIKTQKGVSAKFVAISVFASHLIDIDHLLANPLYDPNRCSINFHPLHSWYMFPIYIIGSVYGKYKYFFWAVLVHLGLDLIDCLVM